MRIAKFCAAAAVVLLSSCATQPKERDMNFLASALTKVAAAVDATVRYGTAGRGSQGGELLRQSTSHDPALLKPFAQHKVRVLRVGADSAVLICDSHGGKALLEDAGCTARVDKHRWRAAVGEPCEFTLKLSDICDLEGGK